jgi:hypothetical protein
MSLKSFLLWPIICVLTIFIIVGFSQNKSDVPANFSSGSVGFWILMSIGWFTRKKDIGGWFIIYLLSLSFGCLISMGMLVTAIEYLNPNKWTSIPYYFTWLLSLLPSYIFLFAEAVIIIPKSQKEKRNWNVIILIRKIIIAKLISLVIACFIGSYTNEDKEATYFLFVYNTIIAIICLIYFYRSKRIKNIFKYNEFLENSLHNKTKRDPFKTVDSESSYSKDDNTQKDTGQDDDGNYQEEDEGDESNSDYPREEEASFYGKILCLKGQVTKEDIKRAYYSQIKKYHPDKVQHLGDEFKIIAEQKTKEINNAYNYFRRKYKF